MKILLTQFKILKASQQKIFTQISIQLQAQYMKINLFLHFKHCRLKVPMKLNQNFYLFKNSLNYKWVFKSLILILFQMKK